MSLINLVFRNLTVLALTGQTLAGPEVRSSVLIPLNELAEHPPVPMIAVFTDTARADDTQIDGNDLFNAKIGVSLALEIACVGKVPTKDQKGIETFIPETDEGMEMTIDVIARQAIAVLQGGTSTWAKLWRDCRVKTRSLTAERGASIEKGVRFAARRIELTMVLLSDPILGAALTAFWNECLAAFDADDRTKNLARMLRKLVEGEDVPDWRVWQAELGLADAGIRGIGVAPIEGAEADDGGTRPALELSVDDIDRNAAITVNDDVATTQSGNGPITVLAEESDG